MLIVLRFIVDQAQEPVPVASTLVSEYAPQRIRGRMVVWLESFWAVGWIMAALLGYFPGAQTDRRMARLALEHCWVEHRPGVLPTLVVRHGLLESVRFLESKGRLAEAERSVRQFESQSNVAPPAGFGVAVTGNPAQHRTSGGISIFSPSLRKRTIALWSVWFFVNLSYYGAFTWLPTLLFRQGHSLVRSFEYTLIITIAQLPGYAMSAWLIEKWGRRPTLATFLLGSGVAAGLFGLQGSTAGILLAGMALSFFNLGAWGALYAIGPGGSAHRDAWHRHWGGRRGRRPPSAAIIAPLAFRSCLPVVAAAGLRRLRRLLRDSRGGALLLPERSQLSMVRVVPPRFQPPHDTMTASVFDPR